MNKNIKWIFGVICSGLTLALAIDGIHLGLSYRLPMLFISGCFMVLISSIFFKYFIYDYSAGKQKELSPKNS